MRRVLLFGSFLALTAALFAMWSWRFERLPDVSSWHLEDLRADWSPTPGVEWIGSPEHPVLRLRPIVAGEPLAVRFALPQAPAVNALHLRFRLSSRGLTPGAETWQDGRLMVGWHTPGVETASGETPVASIRQDDRLNLADVVLQPDHGPAVPTLRLEHLGLTGEFELSDLEITAVRERQAWKTGRWFLALAWLAWITACIRSWPGISRWRALGAAAIWVAMGIHFVIPGPWKIQRPLTHPFQLGKVVTAGPVEPAQAVGHPSALKSGPLPALGKLPDQGSLVLRVKIGLSRARPLLHALLLFAPTMLFLFLVGWRPALLLSSAFAVSIELAQLAFGYGFDLVDVADLATDAAGIALAVWLWKRSDAKLKVPVAWKRLSQTAFETSPPSFRAVSAWFMS